MILGIDTSCYTTSWALVDCQGNLVAKAERLLNVEEGDRGLAQSAALFQHIKAGVPLFRELLLGAGNLDVKGVCASSRPRPQEDSYMPVFLAGEHWGGLLASAWGVPFYRVSHQEGHLMAGVKTAAMPEKQRFLAVHLSGGTSEILEVTKKTGGFAIRLLGGSNDLAAGQFVDRVGVALGLAFPAGLALDDLAVAYQGERPSLKGWSHGMSFSLSGPESAAQRLIAVGVPPGAIAQSVLAAIASALEKTLRQAMAFTGLSDILFVGGVAASRFLKERLKHRMGKAADLYFTPPQYAKDNALGVAWLGLEQHLTEKKPSAEESR